MDIIEVKKIDSKVYRIIYFLVFLSASIYLADYLQTIDYHELSNAKIAGRIFAKFGIFLLIAFLIRKVVEGFLNIDPKRFWRTFSILVVVNFIIYLVIFFLSGPSDFKLILDPKALAFFLGYLLFSITVWLINIPNYLHFKNKIMTEKIEFRLIRSYVISSLAYSFALLFIANFLNKAFDPKIFFFNQFSIITTLIVTLLFVSIFYFIEARQYKLAAEVDEQTHRAEAATAQYEGLKSQLDPHFLFNSLNVLTSLIEENQEKASEFTQDLSKIYRYVLESKELEVVDALEEINFAKKYINLLQIRYEDSFQYEIQDELVMPYEKVVPLSLQILLENTIKHNVVSPQKPLIIKIYKEKDYLVIENNLQRKSKQTTSTKVGLKNIQNRYQLLSNREVKIEETEEKFTVKIPLLTQKNQVMEIIETPSEKRYKEIEERAEKRAKELKGYYSHLGVYCVMCLFFFALNAITSFGHWWFYWPMLGWGIGILIHTLDTVGFGKDWQERKKEELIQKELKKYK